jgi:hypothetical protein
MAGRISIGPAGARRRIKDALVGFSDRAEAAGRSVVGYGAAAKGNTLLNYAGVRPTCCRSWRMRRRTSRAATCRFRIPVRDEAALRGGAPDFVMVLPWNLRDEIASSWRTCAIGARLRDGGARTSRLVSSARAR